MILVAIGVATGTTNTWAEETYEEVYSRVSTFGANNIWQEEDITDWGANTNLQLNIPTSADDTNDYHGLWFNPSKPSSAYAATKSFTINENSKIKYEVNWYVGNSTGRTSNYEYIQFGDNIRISYNSSYNFYLDTNGTSTETTKIHYYKGTNTYPITLIFDTSLGIVESFVFNGQDLTNQVAGKIEGALNVMSFGFQRGGSTSSWAYPNGLKTITVSEFKQEVQTANYTINYKEGETLIKAVKGSSVVGDIITAESVVYSTEGNARYLISAETAPTLTIKDNETNVLNVEVRKPYSATLNLTTTIDDGVETKDTITFEETDDKVCQWSYAYSKYVNKDGIYYIADKTDTYGEKGAFYDQDTINKTVTYSKTDATIAFFTEEQSVSKSGDYTCSNGTDGVVGAQNYRNRGISVGTLPAGNYVFDVAFTANNNRHLVVRQYVAVNADAAASEIFADATSGSPAIEFTLTEPTALIINGANSSETKTNQSEDFDYAVIRRADIPVSISAAGLSTFCPAVPLDFTNATAIEAYKAETVADGKVNLVKVSTVAAGEGVLLRAVNGGEASESIPVIAAAKKANDNMFVGTLEDITIQQTEGDNTNYVLSNVNGVTGFYKAKSAGQLVPAGKAWLPVPTASAAKGFTLQFNGQTTGISDINTDKQADNRYHTLSGVQISNPQTKGIYVKNGKKVVVK